MNNFKNINQKQIHDFETMHADDLRKSIQSKLHLYKFLGSLVEHFIPMQIEVYTKMYMEEDDKKPGEINNNQ